MSVKCADFFPTKIHYKYNILLAVQAKKLKRSNPDFSINMRHLYLKKDYSR